MGITVEQFGRSIISSGLLTADEVKAIWTALEPDDRPKDGTRFAKLLCERGKLTPFQAFEILAGRGSRLVMGEYSIIAQIGAGGMGQVYKAQHRRMKRIVALKVMSSAAMKDAAAVKRFQREVEAAARLEHPNIVTAYDSGDADNVKYLVMQLVDGGDLAELVKKKGPLKVEKGVGYVMQTARGLAYAHAQGVIHRDIKPANLLLHKDGTVKVLDMGLARIEDGGEGLTATEQVMGTVDYMSPEQASDTKSVDGRADIYALGCTLWFLLTGKKVYDAETMIARLMKHRDAPPPSLVKERDDVPWPLEQAFHKMIAKRPQDRYQSMDEVLAALMPFSENSESVLSFGGGGSGGSSLGHSAEMASFMNAMGSGIGLTNHPVVPTKPASGSRIDLTSHVGGAEVETDSSRPAMPLGAGSGIRKTGSSDKQPVAPAAPNKFPPNTPSATPFPSNAFPSSNYPSTPTSSGSFPSGIVSAGGISAGKGPANPSGTRVPKPASAGPSRKLIGVGIAASVALFAIAGIFFSLRDDPNSVSAKPEATPAGNTIATVAPAKTSGVAPSVVPAALPKPGVSNDAVLLESLDYVWSPPENLGPTVNTKAAEEFPSLSSDELCLVFWSRGPGFPNTLMECRRASVAEPFGPAVRIPGPSGDDPFLSADGLTLVYCTGVGDRKLDLRMRGRSTRDSAWSNPQSFDPRINTEYDERQPWISADLRTLTYSCDRPDGLGNRDLWVSRRKSLAEPFGPPENLGKGINSAAAEGDSRILSDGKTMLFSREGRQYLTFTSGTGITASLELHDFPDDAREPWLSPDGKRMYYQARRPNSLGDYDIYMTRRLKKGEAPSTSTSGAAPSNFFATGTTTTNAPPQPASGGALSPFEVLTSPDYVWTAPTSLGPTVNSPEDDRNPYLSADGLSLLFDSNRPGGFGDYDLWESRRTSIDAAWQTPVNLGPEINNDRRDESPSLCNDGLQLFYSGMGHEGAIPSQQVIVGARRKSLSAPWENVEALGQSINSSGSHNGPKVSFDGLTLLYGSNGGYSLGKMDLWYGKRKSMGERFVASDNFRAPISSPGDERNATLSSDNRVIIFASDRDGRSTDLWMAVRISPTDSWSTPSELVGPVNSARSDAGPALSFDGRTLFFHVSDEVGKTDLVYSRRVPK